MCYRLEANGTIEMKTEKFQINMAMVLRFVAVNADVSTGCVGLSGLFYA